MPYSIDILTFDGCVASSIFGYADLFDTANRLAQRVAGRDKVFDTRLVSVNGGTIKTSTNFTIQTNRATRSESHTKAILIPGIGLSSEEEMVEILAGMTSVLNYLKSVSLSQTLIAASCSGTFLLAESGLLDKLHATTTWWLADRFRLLYPQIALESERLLVDEGQVVTAAAGASYHDLALHVIARLEGANLARMCARYMVIEDNRISQQPYVVPWHLTSRHPLIERADAWVRKDISSHRNVEELAKYLGMNTRTLGRHVKKLCGATPQAFIKKIKLERAQYLLETTNFSTAVIGAQVGYEDETAFRRAFLQTVTVSPSQYRKRFRTGTAPKSDLSR